MPEVPDAMSVSETNHESGIARAVSEVDGLDADTIDKAWERFKKDNQTSIEDKLDVLLAQNQEIQTDTARTADLVPAVMGSIAEGTEPQADAMQEESESLEDEDPYAMLDDLDSLDEEPAPEGEQPEGEGDAQEGDVDFAGEDDEGSETDQPEDEGAETPESDVSDEGYAEGDVEDYGEESDVEDGGYEEASEAEETENEVQSVADGEDDEDEEEPPFKKAVPLKSPKRPTPAVAKIRPVGSPVRKTIVSKVDKPPFSISAGYTSASGYGMVAKAIEDIMESEPQDFGLGTDPDEVVAKDKEMLRLMKSGLYGL